MSSLWGALGAVGDVAVDIGMNMSKSALADKLEKQREERADERQKARESRQEVRDDAIVSGYEFFDRDGVLMKRSLNRKGQALDEKLASPDEIETRNRDRVKFEREGIEFDRRGQTHQQNLSKGALDIAMGERRLGDYDEDRGLDRELKRSQINATNYRASGGGGGRGGSPSNTLESSVTGTPSDRMGEAVLELLSTNKPIIEMSKIEGPQLEELARESIRIGMKDGVDPHSIFQVTLRRWANSGAAGSGSPVLPTSRD